MTDNNQQVNEQDEWRVGEFWSSASPGKKVLILSRADQIGSDSSHKDFIRWVVGSRAALARPIGQQDAGADGLPAKGVKTWQERMPKLTRTIGSAASQRLACMEAEIADLRAALAIAADRLAKQDEKGQK